MINDNGPTGVADSGMLDTDVVADAIYALFPAPGSHTDTPTTPVKADQASAPTTPVKAAEKNTAPTTPTSPVDISSTERARVDDLACTAPTTPVKATKRSTAPTTPTSHTDIPGTKRARVDDLACTEMDAIEDDTATQPVVAPAEEQREPTPSTAEEATQLLTDQYEGYATDDRR